MDELQMKPYSVLTSRPSCFVEQVISERDVVFVLFDIWVLRPAQHM